jgi:hypothetical protein
VWLEHLLSGEIVIFFMLEWDLHTFGDFINSSTFFYNIIQMRDPETDLSEGSAETGH